MFGEKNWPPIDSIRLVQPFPILDVRVVFSGQVDQTLLERCKAHDE